MKQEPVKADVAPHPPTVLWVGDAVVSSGFARCTHSVCDYLVKTGWDVHVLGLNYYGDPHPYPYKIYPCRHPFEKGYDGWGVSRLPHLVEQIKPDIVVILNDPWNIPPYMESLVEGSRYLPPVLPWLAVDAKNQPGIKLNDPLIPRIAVWTDFAAQELFESKCDRPISVVPLGVDPWFKPLPKAEARATILGPGMIPDDAFIVGSVGRNQPRKRLDLTLEYFAEWILTHGINNAYLYLHVGPTGDSGFDIPSLTRYYNLQGKVLVHSPAIGTGLADQDMVLTYSMFDCLLNTSQGEGWGLPVLEAMACGVPCIVPNWSGLGSWASGAAMLAECDAHVISAPLNSLAYTVGAVPNRRDVVRLLNLSYVYPHTLAHHSEAGLKLASSLSWSKTAQTFQRLMVEVVDNHRRSVIEAALAKEVPSNAGA